MVAGALGNAGQRIPSRIKPSSGPRVTVVPPGRRSSGAGVRTRASASGASNSENLPLTVAVANLVNSLGGGWHLLGAAALRSMALPLAVFFALQRFFVRGITGGTVKG